MPSAHDKGGASFNTSITGVIKIKRNLSHTAPYLLHISQAYRAGIAQSAS